MGLALCPTSTAMGDWRALEQVKHYGGRIEKTIHPLAPFGFRAVIRDSEGNRVALHSMVMN
ncbi:hypothetical protein [Saccharospirillum sp.]|uniref:hypothetical protein n=1 Tax=Saccharospirillum sp. TaxID=2033801 RepID=UPI0034A0A641